MIYKVASHPQGRCSCMNGKVQCCCPATRPCSVHVCETSLVSIIKLCIPCCYRVPFTSTRLARSLSEAGARIRFALQARGLQEQCAARLRAQLQSMIYLHSRDGSLHVRHPHSFQCDPHLTPDDSTVLHGHSSISTKAPGAFVSAPMKWIVAITSMSAMTRPGSQAHAKPPSWTVLLHRDARRDLAAHATSVAKALLPMYVWAALGLFLLIAASMNRWAPLTNVHSVAVFLTQPHEVQHGSHFSPVPGTSLPQHSSIAAADAYQVIMATTDPAGLMSLPPTISHTSIFSDSVLLGCLQHASHQAPVDGSRLPQHSNTVSPGQHQLQQRAGKIL
jgi:hypothetical protein